MSRIFITKGIPSDHPLSDKPPRMSYSHARLSSAYYTVRDFKNQEQPWSRQSVQNKVLLPFLAFVVIELGKNDCTFGCVGMSKPCQALSFVVFYNKIHFIWRAHPIFSRFHIPNPWRSNDLCTFSHATKYIATSIDLLLAFPKKTLSNLFNGLDNSF